jgi:hypothetical protein
MQHRVILRFLDGRLSPTGAEFLYAAPRHLVCICSNILLGEAWDIGACIVCRLGEQAASRSPPAP